MGAPRFIVFDWDGTAVASREPDAASHLVDPLGSLLESGYFAYVVTGTRHDWAKVQLRLLRHELKPRIVICANRGSEVYRLDSNGASLLVRRQMTDRERSAIEAVCRAVTKPLLAAGHDVRIVSDRLNRMKVDLLPDTESSKGRIEDVVELADTRFRAFGGLAGVLRTAVAAADSAADDLRLTSDAKHIEVGITDKSHSMGWVMSDISRRGGTASDLTVVGDEFGPMGGFEGSDAKTALPGATVYSVGNEPNGVPEGINHLGGGPAQFIRILEALATGTPVDPPPATS